MVACEQAFCLGDMLARSFSWLSCARSFARLRVLSCNSLACSLSRLPCALFLVARFCVLSRGSFAFSLAARKRKWEACTHANHLHVLKSTQQATVIETLFE